MNNTLIDKIEAEMGTDDAPRDTQSERLKQLHDKNPEVVDQVMLCLCGWTLKTLREGVTL